MNLLKNIKDFSIDFDLNLIPNFFNKKYIHWNFNSNILNKIFLIKYINNDDNGMCDDIIGSKYILEYFNSISCLHYNSIKELNEIFENIESYFIERNENLPNINNITIIEYNSLLITIRYDPCLTSRYFIVDIVNENCKQRDVKYTFKFNETENLITQHLIL